jgi:beta-phosphoglucomutase
VTHKLEAVIFDMDGVIADTMELHYRGLRRVAETISVPFGEEDGRRFKGWKRADVMEALLKKTGRPYAQNDIDRLSDLKNEHYLGLLEDLSPKNMLPGIGAFIRELHAAGIKLGLATGSGNYQAVMEKLELSGYFGTMVGPDDIQRGKPDPEIFRTAADRLGVPYDRCAAVEDGESGLRAILSTSMFAVGVGNDPYMSSAHWYAGDTSELTLPRLLAHMEDWPLMLSKLSKRQV